MAVTVRLSSRTLVAMHSRVVGGRAVLDEAASTSQRGRFEICAMTSTANLTVLADLSGRWIDRVQGGRERRLCWTATAVDLRPRVRWQENRCTRIENNPQIGNPPKEGLGPARRGPVTTLARWSASTDGLY